MSETNTELSLLRQRLKKARAHPKLFETIDVILNNTKFLQDGTPKFKEKAIFLFGPEDQYRPEIRRYHEYVKKFRTKKKITVITRDPMIKPVFFIIIIHLFS